MKIFSCHSCGNVLYFENRTCGRCCHRLGYDPDRETLIALDSDGAGFWPVDGGARRFFCANAAQDACNWLLPESQANGFCLACRHNGTIPDLTIPENLSRWCDLEAAKHRLLYSLLRWRLALPPRPRLNLCVHGPIVLMVVPRLLSSVIVRSKL